MIDENTQPEAEAVQAEAPVSLNIQDLANVRQLLDVASQRGAFKPNEFQVVGAVYNKLSTFVDAALKAADAAKAEATPAETENQE